MAAGIAIFGVGFASNDVRTLAIGAIVLAVVTGELCLREHFAGFRSHTLLLAALPVAVAHGLVVLAITDAYRGPLTLVLDLALPAAHSPGGCARAFTPRASATARRKPTARPGCQTTHLGFWPRRPERESMSATRLSTGREVAMGRARTAALTAARGRLAHRRQLATTPGRLRLAALLLTFGAIAFGIVAATAAGTRSDAVDDVQSTESLLVRAVDVSASLVGRPRDRRVRLPRRRHRAGRLETRLQAQAAPSGRPARGVRRRGRHGAGQPAGGPADHRAAVGLRRAHRQRACQPASGLPRRQRVPASRVAGDAHRDAPASPRPL